MRRILGALMAMTLLLGRSGAVSADHLVGPRTLSERMAAAASERDADLRAVDRVLSTPEAAVAAKALGARIDTVKNAVPTLSDRELRDLAQRASVLRTNPVSGHVDANVNDFLVIFLVVAIVVVVISAAR